MKKILNIKDLLEQLTDAELKDILASMKPQRTKETGGSNWKDWYPTLVRKCANRKVSKRPIPSRVIK